ncbi:MAG: hypothetical protein ACI94Y_000284 [Maribacter sp.]|jgi:hypothetical protein
MRILITILSVLVLMGCQTATQTPEVITPTLGPMPVAELQALLQTTDELDIQFLEKSFSMNAPGNNAKSLMASITPQTVEKTPCTEISYLFVKNQGEQTAHIGVFLDEGCAYYIFYENSQPKYINAMNNDGVSFFKRILAQVSTSPQ